MPDAAPSPHTHPIINSMDDPQLTLLVEGIRDRRARLNAAYLEVQRIRKDTDEGVLNEKIDKRLIHFNKALSQIDKALEKALLEANKIIALQLQLGVDTDNATRLIAILKGDQK